VVNGWNNVEDNNSGKTVGVTTGLNFGKFAWYNTYYGGPETLIGQNGDSTIPASGISIAVWLNINPSDKLNS
jgi:hypothetical protein